MSENRTIPSVSPKEQTVRIVDLSKFTPYLVAIACISDLLAVFIPWGEMGSVHWYLPLSVPIGWPAVFMETSTQIIAVAVLIKLSLVVTLVSLLFIQRSKSVLFQLALLTGIGLTGAAFAVSITHGMVLYLGYYVVLVAVVLKIIGLSLNYFEIELVA